MKRSDLLLKLQRHRQQRQASKRQASQDRPMKMYARIPDRMDFVSAVHAVQSQNQDTLHLIAKSIAKKLNLTPVKLHNAIHDSNDLSINTVAQALYHQDDPDSCRLAAAMFGQYSSAPSVMVFHPGDGNDSVWKIKTEQSPEKIRPLLDKHGITQRTFLLSDSGQNYDVLVPDIGRKLASHVKSLSNELNSDIFESRGRAEVIGHTQGPRAKEKSREAYRRIIDQYQRGQQDGEESEIGRSDSADSADRGRDSLHGEDFSL
jgi:hypothetical protein